MARSAPRTDGHAHDAPAIAPTSERRPRWAIWIMSALLVIAVFAALRAMAAVAIPLAVAIFITLAALPLDRAVARRLPRAMSWLGRTFVILFLLLILVLFVGGLSYCVMQIATHLPDVSQRLDSLMPEPAQSSESDSGMWSRALAQVRDMIDTQGTAFGSRIFEWATGFAQGIASSTGTLLAGLVLVLFLVLLALSEADTWEAKLDSILAGRDASWRDVTSSLGHALRRFIATRAALGIVTAIAYTLWFMPFGLDLLLVWAILTFLLNFIPNLGSIVSGVLPTLYAFLTLDPGTALILAAGLIVIEQVIGNWIDPRVQGNRVALSPVVILSAIVFWGWIWGIAGAFLATPMMLAIMVVCNHVAALKPAALLVSNRASADDLDAALAY